MPRIILEAKPFKLLASNACFKVHNSYKMQPKIVVDVVVVDVVDVVVIVFKKLVYTDVSVDLKCCD